MRNTTATPRFLTLALALLLALGGLVGPTSAAAKSGDYLRKDLRKEQQAISQSRAAALVKQRFGGKVLKVQRKQSGDRLVYRVKLLQDSGRVRQVTVDARTGAIIGG
ncbi:peptidase M4 [Exilibacterium tricleocarpae]|uniref:Peptidase M4 n=1 Tax=Exilibacterium tricleocarpae TaxID=2591008 RepID=A0A545STI6_9GAMM|nr:PepSY domain-containing protein [Exilibacterium tricleocarpae]TQV68265.1 peptidase M4 [Exilibacterium tricleocarpae]